MTAKLNICCFSRVNPLQVVKGGMDLHGKLISQGLVQHGQKLTIISTKKAREKRYLELNGIKCHRLIDTEFGARREGWSRESTKKFLELHKINPFDVIWSQSFDAFGLVRAREKLSLPVVATLHGCIEQELKTFQRNFLLDIGKPAKLARVFAGLVYSYLIVQKPILKRTDRIITVSSEVTNGLRKFYGEKVVEKCITVDNGIDLKIFRPDKLIRKKTREELGIKSDEIVLLCLGRITFEKGYHIAIEAVKNLIENNYKVKLLIIGSGDYAKILKKSANENGLMNAIIFEEQVDNADTVQYYNSADIFLMPTLTVEGLPFVLLEAMACGKPVITSSSCSKLAFNFDERNGISIPPGNTKILTKKIIYLIQRPLVSKQISVNARRTVEEHYSLNKMVLNSLSVFKEIVADYSNNIP